METKDDDMDWEKLHEKFDDGNLSSEEDGQLNDKEKDLLDFAHSINQHLKRDKEMNQKFRAAEGWERFQSATTPLRKSARSKLRKLYWSIGSAAAVLIIALFIFDAFQNENKKTAPSSISKVTNTEKHSINKPTLTLGNGDIVTIGESADIIKDVNGKEIAVNDAVIDYNTSASAYNNSRIVMNTLFVPRGNQQKIILADGTLVWLNADSKLTFPSAFNSETRKVTLEGEGYFEVTKDEKRPFTVEAKGAQITVLGTSFDINTYEPALLTTLVEGKVKIEAAGEQVTLLRGEQAIVKADGVVNKKEVDTREFTAWKDGDLYFNNQTLLEISKILSREFDYHFRFEDPTLKTLTFTVDMPRPQNIQNVLDNISRSTLGLSFSIKGNEIIVTRQ